MTDPGILVVGGGIAGQALCEALRDRDAHVPITLVCGEPRLPYDRVQLSELLVSGREAADLQLRPAEWYADHGVEVVLGRRVDAADPGAGLAVLDDGSRLPFSRLALATGSRPLMPPIPGLDRAGVHAFRGPEDCAAIRAAAAGGARRAAGIGGGLLRLAAGPRPAPPGGPGHPRPPP